MECKILKLFFAKKYLPVLVLFLSAFYSTAQTTDTLLKAADALPQKDTLTLYKKIKKSFYKHKATRLLYHAIFVDPAPQKYEEKPLSDKQKKEDPIAKYKERTIRKIIIEVYDPFGYSVNDTSSEREINVLQKLGNKYHVTTRQKIIKNFLLFGPNEVLDPVKVSESERLLRDAGYIRDARIYVENDYNDSIDIRVFVQDKWAVDAPGSGSTSGGHFTVRDRNILGSGQKFEQFVSYNFLNEYEFTGRHTIANISDSYISSDVHYTATNTMTRAGIAFNRDFYSALTKWAGGVSYDKTWDTYSYTDSLQDNINQQKDLNYYNLDLWLGRSINTRTGKHINRRFNNIVTAFRYTETQFQQRPLFSIDTTKININTSLYLGSIGFSLSKFYKDQFIFRFGANEDIPEGIVIQLLYGLSYKEYKHLRYYLGMDVSRGKHMDNIGYLSANLSYGNFFNDKEASNTTLNLGLTYFTDLLRNKRWYYRQFIYLKYINGINKPIDEKITLRPDELYGFNNGTLLGNSKMLLNLEGVTYAPYNLIGFRFAPLVLVGFGMLETDDVKLFYGHVYQSYAIGLLIRNESLINSSFQISVGAYPYLPDGNKQSAKFNPVTSFTVKFRSFAFSRPSVVAYE